MCDRYTYIDYGNGSAEVVRNVETVIVRLTGDTAATECFVIAGALNDAYTRGIEQGAREQRAYDSCHEYTRNPVIRGYPTVSPSPAYLERWRAQHTIIQDADKDDQDACFCDADPAGEAHYHN